MEGLWNYELKRPLSEYLEIMEYSIGIWMILLRAVQNVEA